MNQVPLHSRFEATFESALTYGNPVQDVQVSVEFINHTGSSQIDAFWDGEQCWRVRFSPPHTGHWSWRTHSSQDDAGLSGRYGEFECAEVPSTNEWVTNGPLRVSADGRHLEYANHAPFFWLADTAWNGPLKSSHADWEIYLTDREFKGFRVIQFVATHWLGGDTDAEGRTAYSNPERIEIDPAFFQRLDERINRINDYGLVAAPVLAWAATWNKDGTDLNPGASLSEGQLIVLIRYLVSRYGAHQVVWILAGDGKYLGAEAERWRRVGRATLAGSPRLATMHPAARILVNREFEGESWYNIHGYQSGQWKGPESSRWINARLLEDSDARATHSQSIPAIDMEPCYEDHLPLDMPGPNRIDALAVRRACYWSLLAAPVAGVSYGAHGLWSWEETPAVPLNHPASGTARPWKEALGFPGSDSISHLGAFFRSIEWWRLNPCQEMLAVQPGIESPLKFVSAACSPERDLAVVYAPFGGIVNLRSGFFADGIEARCIDPATGLELWTRTLRDSHMVLDCGDEGDRLLLIRTREESRVT